MKKKNPERRVTQINDQKKLRMKGGGGEKHTLFFVKKYSQVWFIIRNTEIRWVFSS